MKVHFSSYLDKLNKLLHSLFIDISYQSQRPCKFKINYSHRN